jgi:hypothetical protein
LSNPALHRPSLDPHVSLALGMTARPGVTAVLAGAGLSVGAGVPAAWEVQKDLLARAAAAAGDKPEDLFEWWRKRTGADAAYDEVLFASAATPLARKDLLRPFFEPTEDERATGVKVPSAAHRALADMMRDGLIRIIVTLNFDLLIETALRDVGIEPTVVSTVDGVRGMEPLHAQRYLVWHLHGDYTNPEMLNSPDELRQYADIVNTRLDELLDQYGLLVVGWSATWDPALRAALTRATSRRYPTVWLNRGPLREEAAALAATRDAAVVEAPADSWLQDLADACAAIAARTRDPLTAVSTVAAFKRELGGGRPAIAAHDRLAREVDRLEGLPVLQHTQTNVDDAMTMPERTQVLEAELETWAGLVATTALWAESPTTDSWWQEPIQRFAQPALLSGLTHAIESLVAPAIVGLYAAGVSAVAAKRWDVVCTVLAGFPTTDSSRSTRGPAMAIIDPQSLYPSSGWPSKRLFNYLVPILQNIVGLGAGTVRDAWEQFEYLDWVVNQIRNLSGEAHRFSRPSPYLRVTDLYTGGRRREAVPLASQSLKGLPNTVRSLLAQQLAAGSTDRLDAAMSEVDDGIAAEVERADTSRLTRGGGYGVMPSGLRYPRYDETDL